MPTLANSCLTPLPLFIVYCLLQSRQAEQNVDGLLEVTASTIAIHTISEADFDEPYLFTSLSRTWPVSNDMTPPITAAVAMARSCASISRASPLLCVFMDRVCVCVSVNMWMDVAISGRHFQSPLPTF